MTRFFSRLWKMVRSCVPGSSNTPPSPPPGEYEEVPSTSPSPTPISRSCSPDSSIIPRFFSCSSEDATDEQKYFMDLRKTWNGPRRRSFALESQNSNDSGYDSA